MFYMLMILMKFSFFPQNLFRIFFLGSGFHHEIHLKKVMLYILKILTENQNSVQDQDQDNDLKLDFNTRPTFHR